MGVAFDFVERDYILLLSGWRKRTWPGFSANGLPRRAEPKSRRDRLLDLESLRPSKLRHPARERFEAHLAHGTHGALAVVGREPARLQVELHGRVRPNLHQPAAEIRGVAVRL